MTILYRPGETTQFEIPDNQVEASVTSGALSFEGGTTIKGISPTGRRENFPSEEARVRFNMGYSWESPNDSERFQNEEALQAIYGTPAQEFATGVIGAADTFSFGIGKAVASAALGRDYVEKLYEANPDSLELGQTLGYVAPLAASIINPAIGLAQLGGKTLWSLKGLTRSSGRVAIGKLFGQNVGKMATRAAHKGPITKALTAPFTIPEKAMTTLLGTKVPASMIGKMAKNYIRYGGEAALITGVHGISNGLIYPERFSAEILARDVGLMGGLGGIIGLPGPVLSAGYGRAKSAIGKRLAKRNGLLDIAEMDVNITNWDSTVLNIDKPALRTELRDIVTRNSRSWKGYGVANKVRPAQVAKDVMDNVIEMAEKDFQKMPDALSNIQKKVGEDIAFSLEAIDEILASEFSYLSPATANTKDIQKLMKKLSDKHFKREITLKSGETSVRDKALLRDKKKEIDALIASVGEKDSSAAFFFDEESNRLHDKWRFRQDADNRVEMALASGDKTSRRYFTDLRRAIEGDLSPEKNSKEIIELMNKVSIGGRVRKTLDLPIDDGIKDAIRLRTDDYLTGKMKYKIIKQANIGVGKLLKDKGYNGFIASAITAGLGLWGYGIPGLVVGGMAGSMGARAIRKYGPLMARDFFKGFQQSHINYMQVLDNSVMGFIKSPINTARPIGMSEFGKLLSTKEEFEQELVELGATQEDFVETMYNTQTPLADLQPEVFDDFLAIYFNAASFLGTRLPKTNAPSEISRYQRFRLAALDVSTVYENFSNGYISLEEKTAMEEIYPDLFNDLKEKSMDAYIANEDMPYAKKLLLSRIFDVPLEKTLVKTNVQLLQRGSASEIAQQVLDSQKPNSRPGTNRTGGVKGMNRRGKGMSQTDKIASGKVGD